MNNNEEMNILLNMRTTLYKLSDLRALFAVYGQNDSHSFVATSVLERLYEKYFEDFDSSIIDNLHNIYQSYCQTPVEAVSVLTHYISDDLMKNETR